MDTNTSFTQTHNENREMLNELDFFDQEVSILDRHLRETMARNTSLQMAERGEDFLNQFARSRDMITGMKSELVEAEKKMAIYAKGNETANLDAVNVADHAAFRDQYNGFKESFLKMRDDFRKFESEWA